MDNSSVSLFLFINDFIFTQISHALTSVRSINRTDAATLLSTFGSLENIIKSSSDSLTLCPGLGPQKASRLHKALHQPFLKERAAKKASK